MISDTQIYDINISLNIDNLSIYIRQINYGVFLQSYTKHRHGNRYYELHLVCGGKGTLILDHGEYVLEKSTLYMTGPNILHTQLTDTSNPMSEYCIGFEIIRKRNSKDTSLSKALYETPFWIGTANSNYDFLVSSPKLEQKNEP